jgi:methionine sulfoxide reductase heme-binding subunit
MGEGKSSITVSDQRMNVSPKRNAVRIKQHSVLIAVTAFLLWVFYTFVPGDDEKYLWSMATAYTSIIFLGVTLILGPLNVVMRRNNPLSSDLRRDIGIWCGFTGIAHVIIGIQVHMGNIWLYFFKAVEGEDGYRLRSDLFGAANYTGLIAGVILLLLLLLSNDLSMKFVRPGKWKRLQQLSYVFFLFTLTHGIMYQVIEKRIPVFIIVFACLMLVPFIVQVKGYLASRKLHQVK